MRYSERPPPLSRDTWNSQNRKVPSGIVGDQSLPRFAPSSVKNFAYAFVEFVSYNMVSAYGCMLKRVFLFHFALCVEGTIRAWGALNLSRLNNIKPGY